MLVQPTQISSESIWSAGKNEVSVGLSY